MNAVTRTSQHQAGYTEGTVPPRSARVGNKVAEIPKQEAPATIKISTSTKELPYVQDIHHIDSGPIAAKEVVEAWVLENEYLSTI